MADALDGERLYATVADFYPGARSLTGPGTRATLAQIADRIPISVDRVPSGTPVFDWTVPQEWTLRSAWLADPTGRRVVDVADHPLHVLGYSRPMDATMRLDALRPHLFSLPDQPDVIPYRTSYYADNWGFCLPDRQLRALPDGEYRVHIDARLHDGGLDYGELVVPGATEDEVLVTTHICHPAMANDNATGIAVAVHLAEELLARELRPRLTYRFLFIPGTIGSITWLATHEDHLDRIRSGMVLTGLGDRSPVTYKRSRRGDATIDRAFVRALTDAGLAHRVLDFSPYGYDERQFCSPGINLAVGRFGRGVHGEYPEYHSSADDLDFVRPAALAESFDVLRRVVDVLEHDVVWLNTSPKGEPQLGKRGLYRAIGSVMDRKAAEMALLWVLNLADGTSGLLDISDRADLPFPVVRDAAARLREAGLLVAAPPRANPRS